ncbi:phage tail protein [Leucobacter japonicus]|uniref:phage tail protein n=1 Tax=Leucobacter japonicus TaxID=1461259 RepID=UPI0006A7E793|nr:tape measure protein [Leucobacter japonicus]
MAQEVGVAYVTLLPSGRGFGKSVEGQIDSAMGKSEKKTDGFFAKVGTGIKRVGLGVAALAGTVGALAVGGGISRALNIEDAQAKLKGLGHDTKSVETIMSNALASVKGTAFGLDAAATTAASAVASGIKPGQELEKYLRLTADAATIAGVSMEEMGDIINKVQAKGKAQTEDLNRLTERGIPILQMLADEYGVTAEEMSKMVTKGEVDAERFRKALEDNVGGAALESGNTTRGAFANMRAALSRLGLVFVEDGLGGAKTFFNEVTVILDGLAERFRPWVDSINARLSELFNIDGMGDRFLESFDKITEAVKNGPIPQLLNTLAPIMPVIGEAASLIGGALGQAFRELGEAIGPRLPEIAQSLADAVVELAPAFADLLVAILPLIPAITNLLAELSPVLADLIQELTPYITDLLGGMTALLDLFTGSADVTGFADSLRELQGPIAEMWQAIWYTGLVVGFFIAQVQDAGNKIVAAVSTFIAQVVSYFSLGWKAAGDIVQSAFRFIVGLVTGDSQRIVAAVSQGMQAVAAVWNPMWSQISAVAQMAWQSAVTAVAQGVLNVVSTVRTLPGQILSTLSGLGSLLFSVGQQMIQGLINGVGSMIGNAVSAVRNVGGAMLDGVKEFLGIHSPSRVFRDEVGKMVGLGLLEGVADSTIAGRIDTAVSHLVSVPSDARSSAFPSAVTLVDADGSILTRARVVANEEIDVYSGQRASERRRTGF